MNKAYLPASSSEKEFHEAFLRLIAKKTVLLPKGASVSQNNVAREAGCDPSALRKSRYPALIDEIKSYLREVVDRNDSNLTINPRKKNSSLEDRCKQIQRQRDNAVSLLLEAEAKLLELSIENAELRTKISKSNTSAT
jgi:hypothetical protein